MLTVPLGLSVTVTMKLTDESAVAGGVPLSRPVADSVSQVGRPTPVKRKALAGAARRRQLLAELVAHRGHRQRTGIDRQRRIDGQGISGDADGIVAVGDGDREVDR